MILAHVADLHITDRQGPGCLTLDEQVEHLTWIGEDMFDTDVIVVAGDIFDGLSTPRERNAAIEVFTSWASRDSVIVVRGNHDRPEDLSFLRHLDTVHPIKVHDRPGFEETISGDVIACLPWPRKAQLVAALDGLKATEVDAAAVAGMRAILAGIRARFEQYTGARVILSHAELGAASMDNDQPLTGKCDIDLGAVDLLDTEADYISLGHIHKHQILESKICYSGSTHPTAFPAVGQELRDYGYCLVEVERGEAPVIEHRKTPYREMVTIHAEWIGTELTNTGDGIEEINELLLHDHLDLPVGSAVKLVYEAPSSAREQAREQADRSRDQLLHAGASSVIIEPRITQTHRVRSETIAKAQTNRDRIESLWGARDELPARAPEILTKLQTLESEAQA